jgi:hypothetical protein
MERSRLGYLGLLVAFCFSVQISGCTLLIAGAVGGAAAGTAASVKASDEHHSPLAYVGAVLANVVYFPAKVVFAGAGAVTSGLAYLVTGGHAQPATKIWDSSVKGNYVMTPSMVEGETPVHFTGNA